MSVLTIATLNVNGLRNPSKRFALNRFLCSLHVDIVGVQETHSATDVEAQEYSKDFPSYDILCNLGTSQQNGVAILFSKRAHSELSCTGRDNDGRLISASVRIEGSVYHITCVYSPCASVDRVQFLRSRVEPLVVQSNHWILGDFNAVMDPRLDKFNASRDRPDPGARRLSSLIKSFNYKDVYRSRYPNGRDFTWKRHNDRFTQMCRLDLIFCSDDCLNVSEVRMDPWQWSDHLAVSASIPLETNTNRGPGYFHMNVDVLTDGEFVDKVESFWTEWRFEKERFPSIVDWWEVGKCYLRDLTRDHCEERARSRQSRRRHLQATLFECHNRLSAEREDRNIDTRDRLRRTENELRALDRLDAAGARVRSRLQWTERGEQSTRFYARLERQRQTNNTMTELHHEGNTYSQTEGMLEAAASFYERLYSASSICQQSADRLTASLDQRLTQEDSAYLDRPITVQEMRVALASMASNKSPGVDGIAVEFYRRFWSLLESDLLDVYHAALSNGRLGTSQRTGVIILLHKKGERRDLKNWRPISLLSVDYKILTKLLASRLTSVLQTIVHEDQTCCVPERSIRDSCRVLQDTVDYCEATDRGAGLVSLDQEKAFDRVEWSFLDKVMAAMNIGEIFRSYISTLSRRVESCHCQRLDFTKDPPDTRSASGLPLITHSVCVSRGDAIFYYQKYCHHGLAIAAEPQSIESGTVRRRHYRSHDF